MMKIKIFPKKYNLFLSGETVFKPNMHFNVNRAKVKIFDVDNTLTIHLVLPFVMIIIVFI